MAHKFRKLDTRSDFPNIDNVEVYKFDNDFDYSRYDYTQMDLQICSVPWDMGEAHVGNRTISGIGNVVYFGSKSARDAWFDAIPDSECFRFSTKFKELHRELAIDVPIPYDVCARFNYLKVHYSLFANDDSPVMYEDETGLRDWFWFIREVEFVAPNTTRLHILDDAFQTWIYDVDITGMVLERGHAPMFAMKADTFLSNPIDNNEYLLTEDVNFGTISNVKHVDVLELNAGNMYACIATTSNPNGTWGTKGAGTWQTPASASYTQGGQPSVYVFAVPVANLATLLANITGACPQFKQTVQGVFFASSDLITLGTTFTFANVTCYNVTSGRKSFDFVNLAKAQFGYDTKYENLAKLYTSPYAHIEITDENGNVDIVKVEDTDGTLDVSAALSLAYPFITIDAHVMGVGGNSEVTVTYKNVDSHTFKVTGQWYETLRSWSVPIFAVVLDASTEYDYSTHFDRVQRKNDYDTAYDDRMAYAETARDNAYDSADTGKTNADASADAAKANADASADTAAANVATIAAANKANTDASADTAASNVSTIAAANKGNADDSADTAAANVAAIAAANKGNADDSADTLTDNATLTTTANTATTNRSNTSANNSSTNTQTFNTGMRAADNVMISFNATSTIAANEQQGNIAATAGMASSVVNAVGSAVTGDVAGAATSVVNGIIGGASTLASTQVANALTSTQATYAQASNNAHEQLSNTKTQDDTTNQTSTASDLTTIQNTLVSGTTANSAATVKGNATRTQTAENAAASATQATTKGNATRTQTAENAAATATQTTTKGNATRTQTAENTAATATQTTTKANATRTQTASKDNATRTKTTSRGNALRTYNTETANASRDKANAQSDVENDILQAALRSPFLYGDFANGEGSANKPIALFANVVTQSKSAISSAGDEFLRYGYMLDKYWEFDGNWNIGKYFTYWKLRDFWVTNLDIPDMYMDKLRFFLFGGVTVWRSPHDIGKRTIYDNFS